MLASPQGKFLKLQWDDERKVRCETSVLNMASSNSQVDKPQRGRPKRAELSDVNRNTDAQSINAERASV